MILPKVRLEWNPFILSVLVSRFLFRLCICVLSSFRCLNISAKYDSLAHHSSLASSSVLSHLSLVKITHTHGPALAEQCNSQTSEWSKKALCSAPISSHKGANMWLFRGLVLISLPCAKHHPTQELGLLVKSCNRAPHSAKNST